MTQYIPQYPMPNQNFSYPMYDTVIVLGAEFGLVLYNTDFTLIERLRRRSDCDCDKQPAPLLVGFDNYHARITFLRKKGNLKNSNHYGDIWINPDEPIEVRRLKSTFRRVAYMVRQDGESAYFNHESITINDQI